MSTLIPKTGRKTFKARLAYTIIYGLLIVGGITMIIPFLMMLSNSFRSPVDSLNYEIPPKYFYDQYWLNGKYVEQEINYSMDLYKSLARSNTSLMVDVMKKKELPSASVPAETEDYYAFLKELPASFTIMTNRGLANMHPGKMGTHLSVIAYREAMVKKYGSLAALGRAHATPLQDREAIAPPVENWYARAFQPEYDQRMQDFLEFKKALPIQRIIPVAVEAKWNDKLRAKVSPKIAEINTALGTNYTSVQTAPLALRITQLPKTVKSADLQELWEDLIRNDMPIWFVRADASAKPAWAAFLKSRYANSIADYNAAHHGTTFTSFEAIPLPSPESAKSSMLADGPVMGEWSDFISKAAPLNALYIDSTEQRYREYLMAKFGNSLEALNAAYHRQYKSWGDVYLPTISVKIAECESDASAIRKEFMVRNYRTVTNYLVLHGRAFFNTVAYILMALLFTLTVNPVTAYALSRFKLKSTNKILLFMLATMAFPAEIAMIPNFLILKELHLLNTYWALVLPGMANGFNIFLLKGMFDGLPQDLYEAASLDGAGEMVIFWKITMPLVKPFLAYLSLGTFVGCYSAFMFALLLCPDPKMWTIMLFLQQMDWADQPVKFAAYVMASIPTLIVFITCQRIIMRGIVLPTEK